MGLPMYKLLVYEFLASFTVKHGERMYDEDTMWEFRIQNTNFRWTRKEATSYLGFPMFGIPAHAPLKQRFYTWTRLTKQETMGPYPSPYSIKDKVWFYIHCLIATNINVKPETLDTKSLEDLNILWALIEAGPVDWFTIFSEQFLSMHDTNGYLSYVRCTSLITFIAQVCGLKFCCHPDEFRKLDVWIMLASKSCDSSLDHFEALFTLVCFERPPSGM